MNQEDLNKYKDVIKNIQESIALFQFRKRFKKNSNIIEQAFQVMKRHMNKLGKDKEVDAKPKEVAVVKKAVYIIFRIAVYEPIDSYLRDLAVLYMQLVFNWNNALLQDAELVTRIRATSNIVESQLTMLDTINLLKKLLKQGHDMKNWSPPAFELSRHYLETLEKK